MKCSPPIKKSDSGKKKLKIQRVFNNTAWEKATIPLLDGGKGENSLNIKFQWENRRRLNRYVSTLKYGGENKVQVQAKRYPCGTV